MAKVALTTYDNPHDVFEDYDKWSIFDSDMGYNTSGTLARELHDSDALSDEEKEQELERAIDEIIKNDFLNIYRKVKRADDGPSIVYPEHKD